MLLMRFNSAKYEIAVAPQFHDDSFENAFQIFYQTSIVAMSRKSDMKFPVEHNAVLSMTFLDSVAIISINAFKLGQIEF